MAQIEMGRTYRTRDGREVRLLMVDGGGEYPVIGVFKDEGEWAPEKWTAEGREFTGAGESDSDLIEVKPERTGWINIYDAPHPKLNIPNEYFGYSGTTVFPTREDADRAANNGSAMGRKRIACIQITFTEGQGL